LAIVASRPKRVRKTEVEHGVKAEFETARPDFFDLLAKPSIKILESFNRRVVAVKTRHPLVVREPNCRKLPLKLAGEGRFPDPGITMN
jgi:hypothetical protein